MVYTELVNLQFKYIKLEDLQFKYIKKNSICLCMYGYFKQELLAI